MDPLVRTYFTYYSYVRTSRTTATYVLHVLQLRTYFTYYSYVRMYVQVWFVDDATAAASCERLKQWWDALSTFGPHFGYSPNATKTILVVKDEHEQTANSLFSAFFDVRVFHPNAPTYRYRDLAALYKMHEGIKKREYGERVREVERGVFTPLVLSTTGGMARECTVFFQKGG